jgi:PhnB protein
MKFETYIFFTDQCAQAMRFYEKALGGKIEAMMTYADAPPGPYNTPDMAHKVIHARLTVGDAVLMASDGPEAEARKGFAVAMQVDTIAEADRLFNALSDGATITMPMGETFFSKRFGMLTDKFGTPWMVNCIQPK